MKIIRKRDTRLDERSFFFARSRKIIRTTFWCRQKRARTSELCSRGRSVLQYTRKRRALCDRAITLSKPDMQAARGSWRTDLCASKANKKKRGRIYLRHVPAITYVGAGPTITQRRSFKSWETRDFLVSLRHLRALYSRAGLDNADTRARSAIFIRASVGTFNKSTDESSTYSSRTGLRKNVRSYTESRKKKGDVGREKLKIYFARVSQQTPLYFLVLHLALRGFISGTFADIITSQLTERSSKLVTRRCNRVNTINILIRYLISFNNDYCINIIFISFV